MWTTWQKKKKLVVCGYSAQLKKENIMLSFFHVYIQQVSEECWIVYKIGGIEISRHDSSKDADDAALKFRREEEKRLAKNKNQP